MPEQQPFDAVGFMDNPEPRVPCVLVLDSSGSMGGAAIDELNAGVAVCKSELAMDPMSAKRVELAVIRFGGSVSVAHDFSTVDAFFPEQLVAEGETPLGAAVIQAIDLVNHRKQVYKQAGVAYYRPWIFLITDGAPTDQWEEASRRIKDGERQKSFMFWSVGVGGADFSVLKQLSSRSEPLKLKGLAFRDLFQWLSSSLSGVSKSQPNDPVTLKDPTTGPKGWGEASGGV